MDQAERVDDFQSDDSVKVKRNDTLSVYFRQIKDFPLLDEKEEKQLAIKIKRGNIVARQKMVNCNLRLVVSIAKKYFWKHDRKIPLQDLIEEGNIGLIKAADRFKASKGCKFSTYATYWIRQSIERMISTNGGMIHFPVHLVAEISKYKKAKAKLIKKLNRDPIIDEIAKETKLSKSAIERVERVLADIIEIMSTETEMGDGDTTTIGDKIYDFYDVPMINNIIDSERNYYVRSAVEKLPDEKEKTVIKMRFGLDDGTPYTLEGIAKVFGVSRERVRQIEVKALENLRNKMKAMNKSRAVLRVVK